MRVVAKSGRAYIDHMYEHMNVEEKVVFPHIESVLSMQDWRELAEDDDLRAVADPVFGTRVQREFRNMTRKLRRTVRRGVERGTMVEWIGIEALMESLEVVSWPMNRHAIQPAIMCGPPGMTAGRYFASHPYRALSLCCQ